MTDRFQLSTSAEWLDADDDVRAYAARAPPEFALTWQADRSVSFDVAKLLALRTAAEEGSKPATWDGSGGLMGRCVDVSLFRICIHIFETPQSE